LEGWSSEGFEQEARTLILQPQIAKDTVTCCESIANGLRLLQVYLCQNTSHGEAIPSPWKVEYAINRCTRRCHVADRALEPGEYYYSVIVSENDELRRVDIAEKSWEKPPEGAVGWWKSQIPRASQTILKPAPDAVLLETLSYLCEQSGRESLAFLLAVLLVRRHVLTEPDMFDDSMEESEIWILSDPVEGTEYRVPRCWPAKNELERLQKELHELLYCEAPNS
jgi:hypothetical protein